MAKCEVEQGESYTIIKNVAIRDKRLRHSARGLLVFMLSLPPEWDMTIEGLSTISVECADTIRKLINELEAAGYVRRCRERKPDGTFGEMKYYIYQKPLHNRPILKKPILDKPALEKSGQISKDTTIKEEINTELYNISSINPDMLTVFAALSQLEREQLRQRQREGIEIAKAQGKYTGRKPIPIDWAKFGQLYGEWKSKNITARDFMRKMCLTSNTFYRRVREYEERNGIAEPVTAYTNEKACQSR